MRPWHGGLLILGMGLGACSGSVTPSAKSNSTKPHTLAQVTEKQPCDVAKELRALVPRMMHEGKLHRSAQVIEKANRLCSSNAAETWASEVEVAAQLGTPGKYASARALIESINTSSNASESAKGAAKSALEWVDRFDKQWPPKEQVTPEMRAAHLAAIQAANDDRFAEAIDLYEKAWEAWPLNGVALVSAGALAMKLGRLADARRFFDRGIAVMEGRTGEAVRAELPQTFRHAPSKLGWSPNGKDLAVVHGETVVIYDLETRHERVRLEGHDKEVARIAFSANGKRVVSSSIDLAVRVWDVDTGEPLQVFTEKNRTGATYATDLVFSRDGSMHASSYSNSTIHVLNTLTGTSVEVVEVEPLVMTFSPDGKSLIVVGWRSRLARSRNEALTIRVVDVATGKTVATRSGPKGDVGRVVFSPDGQRLLVHYQNGTLEFWDTNAGRSLGTISALRPALPPAVAFSPDGSRLAIGGQSTIDIWDAKTRSVPLTLTGLQDSIRMLAFSPNGQRIASISRDGTARIWDATSGKSLSVLGNSPNEISTMTFSEGGEQMVMQQGDGDVRIWNLFRPDNPFVTLAANSDELMAHVRRMRQATISPDGQCVASASFNVDRPLELWNAVTGANIRGFRGHDLGASRVSFSADGKKLASCSIDKTIRIWDVQSGSMLTTWKGHTSGIGAISFSPDGTMLASGSADKTVRIWDVAKDRLVHTLEGHTHDVVAVAFSPDGKRVVSGSVDASVLVWDVTTGRELLQIGGTHTTITSVAFSLDGNLIAAGGQDGVVQVWDSRTGVQVVKLEGHLRNVIRTTFVSNTLLRTAAENGDVLYWRIPDGTLLVKQQAFSSEKAIIHVSNDHRVDFMGPDACSARDRFRCRIGPYTFPFDLCEDRFYVPDILNKRLKQDASYLEPEFEAPMRVCNAPTP